MDNSTAVKVYESSIAGPNNPIQHVRNDHFILDSVSLEALHVFVFACLIVFIFGKMWMAAKKKKQVRVIELPAAQKSKATKQTELA